MTSVVEGLKPEIIWKYFETLTKIPRPSKHEGKILAYIKKFANKRPVSYTHLTLPTSQYV